MAVAAAMSHVVVVVLGDLGRSPRMQYHACSLCELEEVATVSVVGYSGEKLLPSLQQHSKCREYRIDDCGAKKFAFLRRISGLLFTMYKGWLLLLQLWRLLGSIGHYDAILIQNPPCIPVALVALARTILGVPRHSKVIIDWHNLGYTMFSEQSKLLRGVSYVLEACIAQLADAHICVSGRMQHWLQSRFACEVTVQHDRPFGLFSKEPLSLSLKHSLFQKLAFTDAALFPRLHFDAHAPTEATIHTIAAKGGGQVSSREGHNVSIILSSTSWTEDEDFSILIDALVLLETSLQQRYERCSRAGLAGEGSERVLCIITGKGPLKAAFERAVATRQLDGSLGAFVAVRTLWLEVEDYVHLVGCADLGVCLHTSTSGLDLPMKVLDMFGSGVPVLAVAFPCLEELIQHNRNGMIFASSSELCDQLQELLYGGAGRRDALRRLRAGAAATQAWSDCWGGSTELVMLAALRDKGAARASLLAATLLRTALIVVAALFVVGFGLRSIDL